MSWIPWGKGHTHYRMDGYMEWLEDKWIPVGTGRGEREINVYECLKCGDVVEHKTDIYRIRK